MVNETEHNCIQSVRKDFASDKLSCECDQRCTDDYWTLQYRFEPG